jgi:hypothetical protein
MMDFRIVVEGKEDGNFLRQVMESMGIPVNQDDPFLEAGGRTIEKFLELSEVLERNMSKGVRLLVVIDADDDWESRESELLGFFEQFGIDESHVFTFPDDVSEGCLEDLLFQLIPSEKFSIVECLNTASACVSSLGFAGMDKKDVIHQYVSSNLTRKQKKQRGKNADEESRKYTDPAIWNLESVALKPLTTFLQTHLSAE